MEPDLKDEVKTPNQGSFEQDSMLVWKELLEQAFSGWEPADQSLERIIDRVERKP